VHQTGNTDRKTNMLTAQALVCAEPLTHSVVTAGQIAVAEKSAVHHSPRWSGAAPAEPSPAACAVYASHHHLLLLLLQLHGLLVLLLLAAPAIKQQQQPTLLLAFIIAML
jgi:hypothetical protein